MNPRGFQNCRFARNLAKKEVDFFKFKLYFNATRMAGRPRNTVETFQVTITSTPKMKLYLDDLILEQGYGNSYAGVAQTLVWRAIEELVSKGVLDRRKGEVASVT